MNTAAHVRRMIWKPCFNCTGVNASQPREHCGFCEGKGELPRHDTPSVNIWHGYGTLHERHAGG